MTKVYANKKLQISAVIFVLVFVILDQLFLSDLMISLGSFAKSNGVTKSELTVYSLVIANLVMLIFPSYCLLRANKIKRYKVYPYPGMLIFLDTEKLENEDAIKKARSLVKSAGLYLVFNFVITISVLDIFGVINVM